MPYSCLSIKCQRTDIIAQDIDSIFAKHSINKKATRNPVSIAIRAILKPMYVAQWAAVQSTPIWGYCSLDIQLYNQNNRVENRNLVEKARLICCCLEVVEYFIAQTEGRNLKL